MSEFLRDSLYNNNIKDPTDMLVQHDKDINDVKTDLVDIASQVGVNLLDFKHLVTYDQFGQEMWGNALQGAIDSLPIINTTPLMRNGKIKFPYGVFRIDTNVVVPMGVVLEGVAPISNLANPYSRNNGTVVIPYNTSGACITFKGEFLKGSGCGLSNIKFTGGKGSTTDCLALDDIFYMQITGCVFEHMDVGNVILLKSSTGNSCNWITIDKCLIKNIGDYNTNHTYGRGIYCLSAADTNITNCAIESCGSYGVNLGSANNKIYGCFIDLNNVGIGVFGDNSMIMDTSVKLNYRTGIEISANGKQSKLSDLRIIDNNVSNIVTNSSGFGIDIIGNATELHISDCVIRGTSHNGSIRLGTSGITAKISDCELTNSGTYGRLYDPNSIVGSTVFVQSTDRMQVPTATSANAEKNSFFIEGGVLKFKDNAGVTKTVTIA